MHAGFSSYWKTENVNHLQVEGLVQIFRRHVFFFKLSAIASLPKAGISYLLVCRKVQNAPIFADFSHLKHIGLKQYKTRNRKFVFKLIIHYF